MPFRRGGAKIRSRTCSSRVWSATCVERVWLLLVVAWLVAGGAVGAGGRQRYVVDAGAIGPALARLQGRRAGTARAQPHDRRRRLERHRVGRTRATWAASRFELEFSVAKSRRRRSDATQHARRGFRQRADGRGHRRHAQEHAERHGARRREASAHSSSSARAR